MHSATRGATAAGTLPQEGSEASTVLAYKDELELDLWLSLSH